jgi:hypothetical protein
MKSWEGGPPLIPDLIRNLTDASSAVFEKILNRVQDDLSVLRYPRGVSGRSAEQIIILGRASP